ncbi:MAG: tol-pal system-associated acyl-CoA thioesterase [Chromatiales bacterium]|nr:tol-pal system-associated acyl-CoA thioesterase [Chromatiales bacterium]
MAEFRWPVRVYYEDTDSGGVVYYANYLKFMERARTEWLRSLGFEQDELIREQGLIFAVRDANLHFVRPARFNDLLQVTCVVGEPRGASLVFDQQVLAQGEEDKVFCRGRVTVVCLDAATFRPRPIPAEMRDRIRQQ